MQKTCPRQLIEKSVNFKNNVISPIIAKLVGGLQSKPYIPITFYIYEYKLRDESEETLRTPVAPECYGQDDERTYTRYHAVVNAEVFKEEELLIDGVMMMSEYEVNERVQAGDIIILNTARGVKLTDEYINDLLLLPSDFKVSAAIEDIRPLIRENVYVANSLAYVVKFIATLINRRCQIDGIELATIEIKQEAIQLLNQLSPLIASEDDFADSAYDTPMGLSLGKRDFIQ